MNIQDEIYDILFAINLPVFKNRLDPLQTNTDSVVSGICVELSDCNRILQSDEMVCTTISVVDIFVVIEYKEDYSDSLDTLVDLIITSLLTNPEFVAKFSKIKSIKSKTAHKVSGDTNIGQAHLQLAFEYNEIFDPNITTYLESLEWMVDFKVDEILEDVEPLNLYETYTDRQEQI